MKPNRLALLKDELTGSYARELGTLDMSPGKGTLHAKLPFTVETWCNPSPDDEDRITILVNRTPVTGNVRITRATLKTEVAIFGCNLSNRFKVGKKAIDLIINVQIPHMPITSNGKDPDLRPFLNHIQEAITKAARKCQKANPTSKDKFQNQVILDNLVDAIGHASGKGKYRFSLRQLFYAIRPFLLSAFSEEPSYNWYSKVISEYESVSGKDIPGLYRDDRGVFYHPHLQTEMPLGTLTVETYERPKWTFNKVLYSEKEGFFHILRDAKFPEIHDCALLTSKGQATKALKDLIDLLGETDEEITVFCIHDADASGTVIYDSSQEATRSRPARKVKIINLGLEPEEGLKMGLPVEKVKSKGNKRKPTGKYVTREWAKWLQTNRIELNAMSTPQFLEWLEKKMAEHGNGKKVVPPPEVLTEHLTESLRSEMENSIREKIFREAQFEKQVQDAMSAFEPRLAELATDLKAGVDASLAANPAESWRDPVKRLAAELAEEVAE